MRISEIEAWALRVIDQVRRGQPHEDARVELKAEWLSDPYQAARRIAGHANAAGGEPILWIIGVDEKRGVLGASHNDLAKWYQQVGSHFDEVPPGLTDVNVSIDGNTVVAMLFDTSRLPFVIKTRQIEGSKGGPMTHEVPWREGTSIRSIKRGELLRLLTSVQRLPQFEITGGGLGYRRSAKDDVDKGVRLPSAKLSWDVQLDLYVTPESGSSIVIPFHHCSGTLTFPEFGMEAPLERICLLPRADTVNIRVSTWDAVINGPGMFSFSAEARSTYRGVVPHTDGRLHVELRAANVALPKIVQARFVHDPANENEWKYEGSGLTS